MHEISDKSMTRPSVIQLNPSSNVSGSGSGDNVVDEDDSKSDKPQRSRRSSKASKEDKEFEKTKKYLYMAAVEDVKSGNFSSASKFYDVLFHQTINDFVKNGKEWFGGGRKLEKLTEEEEKKITDLLVWSVERGFGYKHHDVALLIQASYLADA